MPTPSIQSDEDEEAAETPVESEEPVTPSDDTSEDTTEQDTPSTDADEDDSPEADDIELDLADVEADNLFGGKKRTSKSESSTDGESADDEPSEESADEGLSLGTSLNKGIGTVSVFNLDHPDRDEYKNQFQELAAEMQLGEHLEVVIQKNFGGDGGKMTPEEQLAFALVMYTMTVWSERPDSDDLTQTIAGKLTGGN